eukprot:CAMPEP_0175152532 /NCGR_PEP_ID=MMETSP0087-20121206/19171_1 /TAXON_ID=136419 /ORGANISM="Unknown Unknown, Strain D1" /LENGTH=212 /DNA_ID=CAMNT_0016438985 /DNA_START=265 /DNA_END=902 /DNA_ORIENTATION=+
MAWIGSEHRSDPLAIPSRDSQPTLVPSSRKRDFQSRVAKELQQAYQRSVPTLQMRGGCLSNSHWLFASPSPVPLPAQPSALSTLPTPSSPSAPSMRSAAEAAAEKEAAEAEERLRWPSELLEKQFDLLMEEGSEDDNAVHLGLLEVCQQLSNLSMKFAQTLFALSALSLPLAPAKLQLSGDGFVFEIHVKYLAIFATTNTNTNSSSNSNSNS